MAGWVVAFGTEGRPLDERRWMAARRVALGLGTIAHEARLPGASVLVWRRNRGEFCRSGSVSATSAGWSVAWVGQAVDDAGDASERAAELIGAATLDDAALAAINGPFAAVALADGGRGVRVVADRHRHYPIYWHQSAGVSVASTEMACVLAMVERPMLDDRSVELFLRTGELIDDATLFRGVGMLPGASVIEASVDGLSRRRYWLLRHSESARASMDDLARRGAEAMGRAVRRMQRACPRLAVTLSGGLDSRLILGLCEGRDRVPSFTWGLPGCRDIRCAEEFARLVGSPHTVRRWDPPAFVPLWRAGVGLTAGSFGIDSMHMLPFTGLLAEHADAVLNGLAGDVVIGGNFIKLAWLRERSVRALAASSWTWRVPERVDAAVDGLVRARGAREWWVESISREEGASPLSRLNDWLYENRVFRYTNSGTMLLREKVESHAPFFDNDALDFFLTIPHERKLKHALYLRLLPMACPEAARARWARTMVPPGWGFAPSAASMAAQRVVKALAKRAGVAVFRSAAVSDVAGWIRGPWRADVESLLCSERSRERGVVRADGVERIWREHLSGADHTRTIGALVSLELAARLWIDGEGNEP